MSASVPSKSRKMPAASTRSRRATRSGGLRGVIAAQEDRELDVLVDVGCSGFEALDVHVEGREEVLGQELGLDLVVRAAVIDRGDGVGRRGVGRRLRLDVPIV